MQSGHKITEKIIKNKTGYLIGSIHPVDYCYNCSLKPNKIWDNELNAEVNCFMTFPLNYSDTLLFHE